MLVELLKNTGGFELGVSFIYFNNPTSPHIRLFLAMGAFFLCSW